MKLKIVDMMTELTPEALDMVNLTEKEISDLSGEANLEKIRTLALEQISIAETTVRQPVPCAGREMKVAAGMICGAERHRRKRRGLLRIAAAAIAALCLSGTAFALHQWYVEDFFGESAVPEERLDRVLDHREAKGVQMTLAEVIAGEQDANVIVYFERADGKPFPKGSEIAGMEADLSNSFQGQQAVTDLMIQPLEDNHKLAYCFNVSAFQPLLGETLTIHARGIYKSQLREETVHADLSKQFSAYPIRIQTEDLKQEQRMQEDKIFEEEILLQETKAKAVRMPLEKEYPVLQFAGVGFIDGQLAVATYVEPGGSGGSAIEAEVSEQIRNTVQISELEDSRTGERYKSAGMSESGGSDLKRNMTISFYKGLSEEDLPYLTPIAEYSLPETISDGQWSFSYTFKKEESWKSADTDMSKEMDAGRLKIVRVNASTLGLLIQGEWIEHKTTNDGRSPEDEMQVRLVMKDGSTKELGMINSQTHYKGVYYRALYGVVHRQRQSAWEKEFLSDEMIADMKAVIINGSTISLQ